MRKKINAYLLGAALLLGSPFATENAEAASTYAKTRYPIVMVGGFMAFDSILGIEYFYGVSDDLRKNGATVYDSNVSKFQTSEFRGEELIRQIEDYLAVTGAEKVNLIAHSQGAPTARYVAAVRPDLIASVTSVHGMNRGTPVATFFGKVAPPGSMVGYALEGIAKGFGYIFTLITGGPNAGEQSAQAIIVGADPEDAKRFNALYPAGVPKTECGKRGDAKVNGVSYWSWGGIGGYTGPITNPMDPMDTLLINFTSMLLPKYIKHDGVVPLCGQYLGTPIRHNYRHNHIDAMRHLFGMTGFAVDPKTLYRTHANRLKKAGL
ncbi:Lipase [gamma proteobacterium HdN1]|nr:Lipase [gamma proteobacterium HdN1]